MLGACHRVPGIDYRNFEQLGDELPPPSEYNDYCKQCWKGQAAPDDDVDSDHVESDSSDSSANPGAQSAAPSALTEWI